MKSTSKMMVIAAVFLVAAALLVAPGAARDIGPSETVFQYEDGVTFNALNKTVDGTLARLVKFKDDDKTKEELKAVNVLNKDGDYIPSESFVDFDFAGQYGAYFAENKDGVVDTQKVFIREPSLKVDIVLADDKSSSINGKTITKNTKVFFKVMSGDVGSLYRVDDNPAQVKIELKGAEDGSTITSIPVKGGKPRDLTGQNLTKSTVYIGEAEGGIALGELSADKYAVRAVWQTPKSFDDYAEDSEEATFTLSTVDLSVEANKENVVRNNDFSVTVRGDSKTHYYLYIKDASLTNADKYPAIKAGQPSVFLSDDTGYFDDAGDYKYEGTSPDALVKANKEKADNAQDTYAVVETDASGLRTVGFSTTGLTDDRSFTIKVVDPDDYTKDDDVKVKIEEGEVTITAEGAGTYYLGEEIKLSGTNTDSGDIYLFMTGPNLGDENGVALDNISAKASNGNYVHRAVESDDTWEYRWDTSNIRGVIDSGTYTVYAVSAKEADGDNVDKKNLKDVKYQTIGVFLKKPFLTLDDVASRVARGDELKVTGVAEGKPDNVKVWIFGKNKRILGESETVEDDGTFEYTLDRDQTDDLASGQYFLIVQHPMTDGEFNVDVTEDTGDLKNPTTYLIKDATGNIIDLGKLPASEAATALVDALNSANCDDTYAKISFQLEEAFLGIDAIGDQSVGTKFTITGTTNLAVDDELNIDVSGASFKPTDKTQASGFSAASGQVKVEAGDDLNTWSFEVDAADFKPDQYTVKVESVDADVSTSTTFNALEGPVEPTETVTPVEPTTATPEEPTTSVPETTATPAPGFGALVALIGLGAVAFLVMRRD